MSWLHFTNGYFPLIVYNKSTKCVYTAPLPPPNIKKHRKIIENAIGRKLTKDEHIHHINKNHKDNRIENLIIVTPQEHRKLHRKYERVILDLSCAYCEKEFKREMTTQKVDYIKEHNQTRFYCSKACRTAYQIKNKRVITEEERKNITEGKAEGLTMKQISEKYKISPWIVYRCSKESSI